MPYAPDVSTTRIPGNVVPSGINPDAMKLDQIEQNYSRETVGLPTKPLAKTLEAVPSAMDALDALDEKKRLAVNYKMMQNILDAGMPAVKDMWVEIGSPPELDPTELEATLKTIKDPAKQKDMMAGWYAAATKKAGALAVSKEADNPDSTPESVAKVAVEKGVAEPKELITAKSGSAKLRSAELRAKQHDQLVRDNTKLVTDARIATAKIRAQVAAEAAGKNDAGVLAALNAQLEDLNSKSLEVENKKAAAAAALKAGDDDAALAVEDWKQASSELKKISDEIRTTPSKIKTKAGADSASTLLKPPPADGEIPGVPLSIFKK